MRLCFLMRQLIVLPHRPDHVLATWVALLPLMRSAIAFPAKLIETGVRTCEGAVPAVRCTSHSLANL